MFSFFCCKKNKKKKSVQPTEPVSTEKEKDKESVGNQPAKSRRPIQHTIEISNFVGFSNYFLAC